MVDIGRYGDLFEGIEQRKQAIGEKASAFPSREEYLAKDTEERLDTAKEILAKYAGDDKSAVAALDHEDEEHPGMTLNARVGYRSEDDIRERVGEGRRAYSKTVRTIPERILVQAFVHDTQSGLNSDNQGLGQLREGPYVDGEGERQEGWHVFRRQGRYRNDKGDTLTLESKLGQDMVELVDAAVVELIDGVISNQRKFIGGQAVESAVEQPPQ